MFIVTDLASLNRINTNALIIFQRLTDPNIIKSYMIPISYKHMTLCFRVLFEIVLLSTHNICFRERSGSAVE